MELAKSAFRKVVEGGCALRFHLGSLLGRRSSYEIAPGYRHRDRVCHYDDTENTDEWQREVYIAARSIMLENGFRSICDVGCGSGYKLVYILGKFETTGIDLPSTIRRVCERYPDRKWVAASFEETQPISADLIICADVIEHVADPDALMCFLASCAKHSIVISTPNRDLVYSGRGRARFGPPSNQAHVREWNFDEFRRYSSRFLKVERHEITNAEQATQMIVGTPIRPLAA